MKFLIAVISTVVLFGCANNLPVPEGDNVGQFAVPVITIDKSTILGTAFSYTLKYTNIDTQEKGSIYVAPKTGWQAIIEKNLVAGSYCFYAYIAEPIAREGYTFTYASEDIKIDYCFDVKAGQMNVWSHKIEVYLLNSENGGFQQGKQFSILSRSERAEVEEKMSKLKNFELWQPVNYN